MAVGKSKIPGDSGYPLGQPHVYYDKDPMVPSCQRYCLFIVAHRSFAQGEGRAKFGMTLGKESNA